MRTPEGIEKDEIKKFLDAQGDRIWYFNPFMAGYGKSGVADIIGVWAGRMFSIEVKRPGKEPTQIQKRRMAEVTLAGGIAVAGPAEVVIPQLKRWFGV